MKKFSVIGVSALALGAALGTHPALAVGASRSVVANIADYNAAQVKLAGDIVTVPDGLATYTNTTGTLEINSRFTVTLPTGFSFSSQPALTDTGAAQFVYASGGIGSQSVTFTVSTAPLLPGQSATLLSFAVQGVTALETPIPAAAALPITLQATNNSQILNNDPKPLSAKAFASEPGIAPIYFGVSQFIDLTSPALGTVFLGDGADTTTVIIAGVELFPQGLDAATQSHLVLSPDGQGNSLATSDTATITVAGPFNGITGAFLASDPFCGSVIAAGTTTPSTITFPGVPADTNEYALCITAGGTTLLQQAPNGFSVTLAPGTSTDFLGTNVPPFDNDFGGLTYSGGGLINVTNFLTGDDAGYASLLRVTNGGSAPTNIFAVVQPDSGGPLLTGSLGSLGGGTGTVFSLAQIEAAVTGLDLANSGQRATLQLIISGDPSLVTGSSLLVNPGGTVDNVGTQGGTTVFVPQNNNG